MKILIVEDNPSKATRVEACLLSVKGVHSEDVDLVKSVRSARMRLNQSSYDLIIIDIVLPMRDDGEPRLDGGALLLEELTDNLGPYHIPSHVVGLTAFEDAYADTLGKFSKRLLTLVRYSPAEESWANALKARVRHIVEALNDQEYARNTAYDVDVAIVCALEDPEREAVTSQLTWQWEQERQTGDHVIYWRGEFRGANGERRSVVAAAAGRMGMASAAVLTTKMIKAYRPKYVVMPGITAGVRGKNNYGDVVVASPCWDWGSGKWVKDEGGDQRFLPAPTQIAVDVELRGKLGELSRDPVFLAQVRSGWMGSPPETVLSLHVGPAASGASVLADEETSKRILGQHRELIGIEMEVYGVYAAADEAGTPRPKAFSMKGVVDFADGTKDDRYRAYAAYTSAATLGKFAERFL
jgi:nucleoside phosphorylase